MIELLVDVASMSNLIDDVHWVSKALNQLRVKSDGILLLLNLDVERPKEEVLTPVWSDRLKDLVVFFLAAKLFQLDPGRPEEWEWVQSFD